MLPSIGGPGIVGDVLVRRVDDDRRLELFDHLVVLDLNIGPPLFPVDQFLDRARARSL